RIPIKDIQKRNRCYQELGINPIWILGAKQFKRSGYDHLKIDSFTLQFIHHYNPQTSSFIYYFCPDTRQFVIVSDLYLTTQKRAIHKLRVTKMENMNFNSLFSSQRFNVVE